jgi:hypothetical protein
MKRSTPLLLAALVVAVLLVCWSLYARSWGGVVLVGVMAAGYAWYRVQVARGEAAEQFFGDLGEDTRLTSFQGGSPSEMPVDRSPAGKPPQPRPPR